MGCSTPFQEPATYANTDDTSAGTGESAEPLALWDAINAGDSIDGIGNI